MAAFNRARSLSLQAFRATLDDMKGKPGVSEVTFCDGWLKRLRQCEVLFPSGWYDPPPSGLSVLFATASCPQRISFESLREEAFWPSREYEADWNNGLMFFYSSSVDRESGVPGDFDVTLYWGRDERLRNHYRRCFDATSQILSGLAFGDTSHHIYRKAEEIFHDSGLRNCVASRTDVVSLDLGHTLPGVKEYGGIPSPGPWGRPYRERIRTARRFINGASDWEIEEGMQFTIEPQLRSLRDPELPQISFHYLVQKREGCLHVCRDIDEIIRPSFSD